jgi:hypothetical protein
MSKVKTFNSVTRGPFADVFEMQYTINDKMVTLYIPTMQKDISHSGQFLFFTIPDEIFPSNDASFFSNSYQFKEDVIDVSNDIKLDIYSNNPNKEFRFCIILSGSELQFGDAGVNLTINGFCISYFI